MRSKIPSQKFVYPSVSHTNTKEAIAIDEYLQAVISYYNRALKMHSLDFWIRVVKSCKGLARNKSNFKYSEHEGTIVLHWRNSNIAFSHLIISLGEKAKHVSCIIASKEKQSISCLSSTYFAIGQINNYITFTASLRAAPPISQRASLVVGILDKNTSTQQQAFYIVVTLKQYFCPIYSFIIILINGSLHYRSIRKAQSSCMVLSLVLGFPLRIQIILEWPIHMIKHKVQYYHF